MEETTPARTDALKKQLLGEEQDARASLEREYSAKIDFIYLVLATIRESFETYREQLAIRDICQGVVMFLFAKVLRTCRAAVISTITGYATEGEVLVRSALEALINMLFITKEDCNGRATLFAEFDHIAAKDFLEKVDRYPDMMSVIAAAGDLEERRRTIADEWERVKANYPRKHFWAGRIAHSLREMARDVHLEWYYDVVYWFGSNQTHANARSAQEYMEVSKLGVPKFTLGPSVKGVSPTLTLISDLLIRAFECLCSTFAMGQEAVVLLTERRRVVFGSDERPMD